MDKFEENNLYNTETHTNELDSIFSQNSEDFDEVIFKENKERLGLNYGMDYCWSSCSSYSFFVHCTYDAYI